MTMYIGRKFIYRFDIYSIFYCFSTKYLYILKWDLIILKVRGSFPNQLLLLKDKNNEIIIV